MALEKYHARVEHRPRTQHGNANGLSKRTNDYRWREKQLEKLSPVAKRWNFLSQDDCDQLPVAPWFVIQVVLAAPRLVQRIVRRTKRKKWRDRQKWALPAPLPAPPPSVVYAHEDFYSDYPEDCIDVTDEASYD